MGKTADELSGIKYPAGGGNDIGTYKQPQPNPNKEEVNTVYGGYGLDGLKISIGAHSKGVLSVENKYGTKTMKGYGAATKGRKISGKQG